MKKVSDQNKWVLASLVVASLYLFSRYKTQSWCYDVEKKIWIPC